MSTNPYTPPNQPSSPEEFARDDKIEAKFFLRGDANDLTLECGSRAFRKLRDALLAEAGEAATQVPVEDIRLILIVPTSSARPNWVRDRLVLLGCALAFFPILFVLVVGISAIAGWIRWPLR